MMAKTNTKNRRTKKSSTALSRTSIFASSANAVRRVDTPELNVEVVYVRSVRSNEFNAMRAMSMSNGQIKEDEILARLVTLTACDAQGKRLFQDDDWQRVNALPIAPVFRIFRAAMKLNNISDEDVKEIAKNLPKTPSFDSG